MGEAVWEFMWLLDKITKIQGNLGYVLGGKPINLEDLANDLEVHEVTVSRNLQKLVEQGYISTLRTPYGLVIKVMKAKKRFNKDANSLNKYVKSDNGNVKSNKTTTGDSTVDTLAGEPAVGSPDIVSIIKAFEDFNPVAKRWYGNKTQRGACERLITTHGTEKVLKVITFLPTSNKIRYLPKIYSPLNLEEKWLSLEDGLLKKKDEQLSKGRGLA